MLVEDEARDEALEAIWKIVEERSDGVVPEGAIVGEVDQATIGALHEAGILRRVPQGWRLTEKGLGEARVVIRRARLAERLVADVIRSPLNLAREVACHFEHVLRRGVDEAVCTLLGHPARCPHGLPIPPGECCTRREREARSVISRLADLDNGATGRVAYLNPSSDAEFQKLSAMGVLPGERITLIRRFPSYVFAVGSSQFAVDQDIAEQVFVRVDENDRGTWRRR